MGIAAGVLLAIGLGAAVLSRRPFRHRRPADGEARITGSCGDTMALQFSVANGRLTDTAIKVQGCAFSFSCLRAAADAARNRTPEEVLAIDTGFLARKVGPIPDDHQHCLTLAVRTLHTAVDHYMQRQRGM
jgi:NifU-like protein involved in Fe-S cluster formation